MKKLVLTTVCAMSMVGVTFAQGLVNWQSSPSANFIVDTNTAISTLFGGSGVGGVAGPEGPGATGAGFYEVLLYGSQNTTGVAVADPSTLNALLTGWNSTELYATNGSPTISNGRLAFVNPNGSAVVPWGGNTDATGQSNNIVLVGWSANLGTTWLQVSNVLANWATDAIANAYFGLSATGFLTGNDSPSSGAIVFGSGQTGNGATIYNPTANPQELYLLPVPEPATMALVGLGGLSLMLFRRQRK